MAKDLKLGLQLGYWGAGPPADALEKVAEAERLGYDSIWTAEAYGSDALTPLAWLGASTSRVRLGTAIVQLSARTPTATAMAALTLDHLSGGRVVLGLGVSGPQVVEGWYGATFPKPLARTREYVDIVRQVLGRAGPVVSAGPHYPLPRTGPDTESWKKAEVVWCSPDRNAALTRAKTGAQLDMSKTCAGTPVAREYALGQSIGVRGTPAIVTEKGDYIEGYMPPRELVQQLKDLQLAKR